MSQEYFFPSERRRKKTKTKRMYSHTDLSILSRLNTYQPTILYRVLSPFWPVKGSYQNRPRTTSGAAIASTLQSASLTDCNLTKDELHALKRLKNDRDIVILPADKGRVTVVMDKDYTDKMDSLVNEKQTYETTEA